MTGRTATRRIVAAVLSVVLLCTAAGCTGSHHRTDEPPTATPVSPGHVTPPTTLPRSPSPSDTPQGTDGDDGPGTAMSAAPAADALATADAYARAWARPNLDQAGWLAGVTVYATPGYARLLRSTDPRNIPAHAVTGAPVAVSANPDAVVVEVGTDAGVLRLACVHTGSRWLVATAGMRDQVAE